MDMELTGEGLVAGAKELSRREEVIQDTMSILSYAIEHAYLEPCHKVVSFTDPLTPSLRCEIKINRAARYPGSLDMRIFDGKVELHSAHWCGGAPASMNKIMKGRLWVYLNTIVEVVAKGFPLIRPELEEYARNARVQ
jgi:hypothetical protein